MINRYAVTAVLLAGALTVSAWANGKGKLTLDLYMDWEYVAAPQISSDASQIVYTRRWTDKVNDKFETDVWIMNSDGSKNRFLVKGSSPLWSPDGRKERSGESAGARSDRSSAVAPLPTPLRFRPCRTDARRPCWE